MKRNFIITVDTEGDNQWSIYNGQNITTENANFIPRFQEMCEEFGFKPVYLVNYEMANNDFLMDYLKKKQKEGVCEIGTHLHSWYSPPEHKLERKFDANPYIQLVEAMFRYLFGGSEEEKRVTISSVTAALVVGMTILAAVIALIQMFGIDLKYPFLIYLNYITNILFDYMQKIARCQQRNSLVAVSGVINTSVMLAVEAMALLVFKMRVDGMLLANCVSYFVAVLYLEYKLRIEEYLSIAAVNVKRVKELLKYSLPLVPNSVCWWVVSACDRYVISFFLSISANGIYSIAGKFSQMLSMITSVFQMAWQESSIIESDKATRDEFYTKTFDSYMRFLLSGYVVLLPIIRLAMPFLVAEEYRIGYLYNPLLLLGAVFSAFSQFYGSAYLAFKKTGGALSTTIIAAIINVTVGACLISKIGLYAPALGTTCAFLAQWLLTPKEYMKK